MEIDSTTELGAIIHSGIGAARNGILVRNYEGASSVLMEVLKVVDGDAYETRVEIYDLLMRCPLYQFQQIFSDDALRVTRHIIEHRREFSRAVHLRAQVVYDGFVRIHGPDPLKEVSEAYALDAAREELACDSGHSEARMHALMLLSWFEDDAGHHAAALEELMEHGCDWNITHGLVSVPMQFHLDTQGDYLQRAIEKTKEPYHRAHLFGKKMNVMVDWLTETDPKENPDTYDRIIGYIRWCYVNLLLIEPATRWRVYAEYYMAVMSFDLKNHSLALFHARSCHDLAGHIGIEALKNAAGDLIKEIQDECSL